MDDQYGPSKGGTGVKREDAIIKLAQLDPRTYDHLRKEIAKEWNIRVSTLDSEVKAAQKEFYQDNSTPFSEVQPWDGHVIGYQLLDEIQCLIGRFVVCSNETTVAIALWIAMTWLVSVIEVCPLAVITAPEKRCGKSVLLTLIGRLVYRAMVASNISSAALFRSIDARSPTLLLDEADTYMRENEELRGIINSGHTKDSAYVIRVVGDEHIPTLFNKYGAKAIAGIGRLPDTVIDRAVVFNLRRKLPSEDVERLRRAPSGQFTTIRRKLARFVEEYGEEVHLGTPHLPDELNDREQDNWESLLAIADAAGGDWPQKAREAALKLSGVEQPNTTVGTDLLADIKEIFAKGKFGRIRSLDLVSALCCNSEKRWGTFNRGKPISPRQVSMRLAEYGIKSKDVRLTEGVFKGYEWSDFEDVCNRYLAREEDLDAITFL